jgi:hypothetical protein
MSQDDSRNKATKALDRAFLEACKAEIEAVLSLAPDKSDFVNCIKRLKKLIATHADLDCK